MTPDMFQRQMEAYMGKTMTHSWDNGNRIVERSGILCAYEMPINDMPSLTFNEDVGEGLPKPHLLRIPLGYVVVKGDLNQVRWDVVTNTGQIRSTLIFPREVQTEQTVL